jgi:hypothetical protein
MGWYKIAQDMQMKCSPANVEKLLQFTHRSGQTYLFDMGEEHSQMQRHIERIGNKRYKLQFLLNAFYMMLQDLSITKLNFEPNQEAIEDFIENSDWEDGYDHIFNEDNTLFWSMLEGKEDEVLGVVREGYEDDEDIVMETAFNYPASSGETPSTKELVSIEDIARGLSKSWYFDDMISQIGSLKWYSTSAPVIVGQIANLDMESIGESDDAKGESERHADDSVGEWAKRNNIDLVVAVVKNAAGGKHGIREERYNWDSAAKIAFRAYAAVAKAWVENMNSIPGSGTRIEELIENTFKDDIRNEWWEQNREQYAQMEMEREAENAYHNFETYDMQAARRLLPSEQAREEGARHRILKGLTERLKGYDWMEMNENTWTGHVHVSSGNDFANFGIEDWEEVKQELNRIASESWMTGHEEYVEEIDSHVTMLRWIVASDPDLSAVFSGESPDRGAILQTASDLGKVVEKSYSVILTMPDADASKMKASMTEENPEIGDWLNALRDQEEIERAQMAEQRARALIDEQKKEQERIDKAKIERKVEKESVRISDPGVSTRRFTQQEIEKAKQEGIVERPFEHASNLQLNVKYPGRGAFIGDTPPMHGEVPLKEFHIAIHPRPLEGDPERMSEVFDRTTGLNYHGYSFPKHEDKDYYDYIGWVAGHIDLYNKIMWINEIQSDVMQSTPRMSDVAKTKASLIEEEKKLGGEIEKIRASLSGTTPEEYYDRRIQELKKKMLSGRGEEFMQSMQNAISKLEESKANGVDPFEKEKRKINDLKKTISYISNQIEELSNRSSGSALERPHLSELRSRTEKKFADWVDLFYNEIFMYCSRIGIKHLYVATSSYLYLVWRKYAKPSALELYKKIYDQRATKHGMRKVKHGRSSYWYLNLEESMPKFAMKGTGQMKKRNWYSMAKHAMDFSGVYIDDIRRRHREGEITREQMEDMIRERYMEHAQDPTTRDPKLFAIEAKVFIDTIRSLEGGGGGSDFDKIQEIKEAIKQFLELNGKKYTNKDGELEEPFKSVLHRMLIQKFNYDMDLDEMVDSQ